MRDEPDVVGVEWTDFLKYFRAVWKQGQHVALIGPTGCGKTTCAVGLAGLRNWVILLDAKGGDTTLDASGYQRVSSWPLSREIRKDIAEGRPARLVMGFIPSTMAEYDSLKSLLRSTIEGIWVDGGWTVEIDEAQIVSDRKMMNLGPWVEKLLVAARDKNISTINAFQAPAWVPTATTRQATWMFVFPTRDIQVIKTLAEKSGRDWHTLVSVLHSLPPFHCVVMGLNPRDPMIITCPKEV